MLVLLTYFFDETATPEDKANFLVNVGRQSAKHRFLSEGAVLARVDRVQVEDLVEKFSAGIPSLHLIVSLGVRAGDEKIPTIVSTPGILDTKDWYC